MNGPHGPERTTITVSVVLIAVVLISGALYLMRPVVLPIVLAIFLASLARPIQVRLQRIMPTPLALVATVLATGGILIAFPLVFATNLQVVIQKLPAYGPRLAAIVADIEQLLRNAGIDASILDLSSAKTVDTLVGVATEALQGLASFFTTSVLIIFLLIFVLAEANIIKAVSYTHLTLPTSDLV